MWSLGLSLVTTLMGHVTLRHLSLAHDPVARADGLTVGTALGQLLVANSPLETLVISCCFLGDGLFPFMKALQHNTHLRRLDCS